MSNTCSSTKLESPAGTPTPKESLSLGQRRQTRHSCTECAWLPHVPGPASKACVLHEMQDKTRVRCSCSKPKWLRFAPFPLTSMVLDERIFPHVGWWQPPLMARSQVSLPRLPDIRNVHRGRGGGGGSEVGSERAIDRERDRGRGRVGDKQTGANTQPSQVKCPYLQLHPAARSSSGLGPLFQPQACQTRILHSLKCPAYAKTRTKKHVRHVFKCFLKMGHVAPHAY